MMMLIIMFVSFHISKEYFLSGFFLVFKYLHRFFLVGMTPSLVMAGTIPNFLGYDKFYPCHSLCNYIIQSFFDYDFLNRGKSIFKEYKFSFLRHITGIIMQIQSMSQLSRWVSPKTNNITRRRVVGNLKKKKKFWD